MAAAIVVLALLGLGLLAAGLAGRRIGEESRCRRCRYVLAEAGPDAATEPVAERGRCPECGAELDARDAVVRGVRRARRLPAALGLVVLLVAGGMVASRMARLRWVTVAPAWWLVRVELPEAGPVRTATVATELAARVRDGRLGHAGLAAVARRLIAHHARVDEAGMAAGGWTEGLGEIVLDAYAQRLVDDADMAAFLDRVVKARLVTSPTPHAHRLRPRVEARRVNGFAGVYDGTTLSGRARPEWALRTELLTLAVDGTPVHAGRGSYGMTSLGGSGASTFGPSEIAVPGLAGTRRLTGTVRLAIVPQQGRGRSIDAIDDAILVVERDLEATVEIRADDLAVPRAEVVRRLQTRLERGSLRLVARGSADQLVLEITRDPGDPLQGIQPSAVVVLGERRMLARSTTRQGAGATPVEQRSLSFGIGPALAERLRRRVEAGEARSTIGLVLGEVQVSEPGLDDYVGPVAVGEIEVTLELETDAD